MFKSILTNWIPIEPGSFYYGDEKKVLHTIHHEFEIADIPVTEYVYNKSKSNKPIVNITWFQANECCLKLSKQDPKYNYRLPYSFEWEYVMRNRGKANGLFFDMDNESKLSKYAVYDLNEITDVKTKLPRIIDNKYAIYDMEGLVWEWTSRYNTVNEYLGIGNNGKFSGSFRVIRGGSWNSSAQFLRSGYRFNGGPAFRYSDVGFRLVRTLK